ncbi:hypothetical protein [Maricaulis maris]|uniref:Uncharacterized protein n=1 Tax=Maricaulis maris TaxID=74318 RepID=A0A495D3U7_9PROT|nr:hypothetical protein [Maricaulis maris]RKQ95459.1 hypothetical protein C7435_2561 [Maricaulis maris]
MSQYYIADLRPEWRANPYITFWRANNSGYAYPLSWAGRYGQAELIEAINYYWKRDGQSLIRFPIHHALVKARGTDPAPGIIDSNVGPVVPNTPANRRILRRRAFIPEALLSKFEVVTDRFNHPPRCFRARSAAAARWADYSAAREAGWYTDGFYAYLADSPKVTEVETGKVTR